MILKSREIRLKNRPIAMPQLSDFELSEVTILPPGAEEVQVKNTWMSVDPYMRGRMNDTKSYITPFEIGKPLSGAAIGVVLQSNSKHFNEGDLVVTGYGWREFFNAHQDEIRKVDSSGLPPQAFLGVMGMPGKTAYYGLLNVAQLKPEDTLFISAAAGAVGQVACQIAKLKGATVIASAGGAQKGKFLQELGVHKVIDYKAHKSISEALAVAAPNGIDVYFDSVGGAHLDAALRAARQYGRFALCGMIGDYNADVRGEGVHNLFEAVRKDISLRGFIISNHFGDIPDFNKDMSAWIANGDIVWKETIEDGIANAPRAFLNLFSGQNVGKMLVRLD